MPNWNTHFVFIFGRQRSGTTVFRKYLDAQAGATDLGEVFHRQHTKNPRNYFAFVKHRIDSGALSVPESFDLKTFREYLLDRIENDNPGPKLVDVKYNALGMINHYRPGAPARPALLHFAASNRVPAVHIVRRNKLAILVSNQLAVQTGVWSIRSQEGDTDTIETVALDANKVAAEIDVMIREENYFTGAIAWNESMLLPYEEMFSADGSFSLRVSEVAEEIVGSIDHALTPPLVKQRKAPLSTVVRNFDEVARALCPTEHAWMLDD